MVEVRFTGMADEVLAEIRKFTPTGESVNVPASGVKEKVKKTAESVAPTAETKKVETASPSGKVTFQEIKEIIPKVLDKLGKPGIVELLAKFGAKKGSDLKEEQYQEFMELAKKSLE